MIACWGTTRDKGAKKPGKIPQKDCLQPDGSGGTMRRRSITFKVMRRGEKNTGSKRPDVTESKTRQEVGLIEEEGEERVGCFPQAEMCL